MERGECRRRPCGRGPSPPFLRQRRRSAGGPPAVSQACYESWPCSRWGEPVAATAGSLVSAIGNRTTPAVNELTQKLNESNSARDQAVERIDLLIAAEIARARRLHAGDEQFRGLYISEAEVDLLLRRPVGQPRWAGTGMAVLEHGGAALDQIRLLNRRRSAQSVKDGIELRLECLERCFGLSRRRARSAPCP